MDSKRSTRLHQSVQKIQREVLDTELVHSIDPEADSKEEKEETMKFNSHIIIGVYAVIVILGVTTGYFLSKSSIVGNTASTSSSTLPSSDKAVGSTDTKTFKDSATGVIEAGGSSGEGTHKLIRDGGPSQTAYLMSSIVDLDEFVGKKVTVWGQTMTAKKVSWLMDVGKIETIKE